MWVELRGWENIGRARALQVLFWLQLRAVGSLDITGPDFIRVLVVVEKVECCRHEPFISET